jgi:hypothetical protein
MFASMLIAHPFIVLAMMASLLFASGYGLRAALSQWRRRKAVAEPYFPPVMRWTETTGMVTAASPATAKASIWQISQVGLNDNIDLHDRVGFVGGIARDGSAWKIPTAIAIQGIESGKWKFYVRHNTQPTWVVVATHGEHKYLKTENDGLEPDSLLKLPRC